MEIRKITEKERRTVRLLHRYCFGDWFDTENTDAELAYIHQKDTFGLFDENKLVSTVMILKFKQALRGVVYRMGGISAVGTYPEARYQGYIRQLLQAAFEDMKANGIPLSMLAPFKERFYARFGYTTANATYWMKAPTTALSYLLCDILPDG